jgi:hypothetical protein
VIRAATSLLVLVVLALLALPGSAMATPLRDCSDDGDLDKPWKNSELRDAIDNLPTDLDEYSNCREVFKGAISSGSDKRTDASGNDSGGGGGSSGSGSGSGSGGGGSISADEQQARVEDSAELEAITGDAHEAKPQVNVGGERLEPEPDGLFDLASASNDIPTPLLVALIAIGVLAILGGVVALRNRVPALGRIPLVSRIPRVSLPRFRR